MLKEIKFGREAVDFIRQRLLQGNTLSTYLLNLPFEDGQVKSYLPVTDYSAIKNFSFGGVTARHETEPMLIDFISSFLNREGKNYAVFEDHISLPTDPIIAASETLYFTYKSEVYHFLGSQSYSNQRITDTVRRVPPYPFIGVLTSLLDNREIQTGEELSLDVVRMLAHNTEHIIVGAYDGEGDLIWSKHK